MVQLPHYFDNPGGIMGGYGSGRRGNRPVVEQGLMLDLNRLLKDGLVPRGSAFGSVLAWTDRCTGERTASVSHHASLQDDQGALRLTYDLTSGENKHHLDYEIEQTTTTQPFGGRRWWF